MRIPHFLIMCIVIVSLSACTDSTVYNQKDYTTILAAVNDSASWHKDATGRLNYQKSGVGIDISSVGETTDIEIFYGGGYRGLSNGQCVVGMMNGGRVCDGVSAGQWKMLWDQILRLSKITRT
jgi:hypothetical protein